MKPKEKTKPFPTFPVPAGAPKGSFAIDPDDEMIALANSAGRDPVTEKAASIVMPLLTAKKVTPKMIRVMLDEILRVRGRLKALDELARQAQELEMGYGKDDPVPTVFDRIRALRARQKPLPKGGIAKLIRGRYRWKRVLSPEFKKLMAKKTVDSTQDDLDAVRGDL